MNLLVAYDIEDDKRRKRVSEILEGYGVRVNYSVFEVKVSKKEKIKMIDEIKKIAKKEDNIRFYHICESCKSKSFELFEKYGIFENFGGFV
ncbi:CRISPR-associated endonuclease Cas2 [Caminibacter sp.]